MPRKVFLILGSYSSLLLSAASLSLLISFVYLLFLFCCILATESDDHMVLLLSADSFFSVPNSSLASQKFAPVCCFQVPPVLFNYSIYLFPFCCILATEDDDPMVLLLRADSMFFLPNTYLAFQKFSSYLDSYSIKLLSGPFSMTNGLVVVLLLFSSLG